MNNTRFVVVDFEMANHNLASICQLGFAVFENHTLVDQWESLVNPLSEFGYYQTRVHGLTPQDVADAPTIHDLSERIKSLVSNEIVCSFGMNDFHALNGNFQLPECKWMDISKVCNRVWTDIPKGQRNLKSLCQIKNIALKNHHNALGDAIASGELLNILMQENTYNMSDLLKFSMRNVSAETLSLL